MGPTGPRWAPCWPHELCYRGWCACCVTWISHKIESAWWLIMAWCPFGSRPSPTIMMTLPGRPISGVPHNTGGPFSHIKQQPATGHQLQRNCLSPCRMCLCKFTIPCVLFSGYIEGAQCASQGAVTLTCPPGHYIDMIGAFPRTLLDPGCSTDPHDVETACNIEPLTDYIQTILCYQTSACTIPVHLFRSVTLASCNTYQGENILYYKYRCDPGKLE